MLELKKLFYLSLFIISACVDIHTKADIPTNIVFKNYGVITKYMLPANGRIYVILENNSKNIIYKNKTQYGSIGIVNSDGQGYTELYRGTSKYKLVDPAGSYYDTARNMLYVCSKNNISNSDKYTYSIIAYYLHNYTIIPYKSWEMPASRTCAGIELINSNILLTSSTTVDTTKQDESPAIYAIDLDNPTKEPRIWALYRDIGVQTNSDISAINSMYVDGNKIYTMEEKSPSIIDELKYSRFGRLISSTPINIRKTNYYNYDKFRAVDIKIHKNNLFVLMEENRHGSEPSLHKNCYVLKANMLDLKELPELLSFKKVNSYMGNKNTECHSIAMVSDKYYFGIWADKEYNERIILNRMSI